MRFFIRRGRTLLLLTAVMWLACAAKVSETGTGTNNVAANQTAESKGPKPKAAVYIMGNPAGRDALRMAVNTFLVKSGKYQMVAVDAIDVIAKEHNRQMSGDVSDEEIARLGHDAGAQYVCVVERTELDGYSYVATRMISVESKVAEFADIVKMPPGGDVIEFIQWQIGSMLGMAVGPRPAALAANNVASAGSASTQTAVVQGQGGNVPNANTAGNTITIKTVKIGNQVWMAENLNIKIGNSWCYKEINSYCDKYGRLYDWETAKKACPKGWHLPSKQEWDDLIDAAGGKGIAGKTLKAKSGWDYNDGTDAFGFSALPGGRGDTGGRFYHDGSFGNWWAATGNGRGTADGWYMAYNHDYVTEDGFNVSNGLSVRCVKD